jgi:hypothetical protein
MVFFFKYFTVLYLSAAPCIIILEVYTLCRKNSSVVAGREIGLEVNADKTKYMVMSQDQDAG